MLLIFIYLERELTMTKHMLRNSLVFALIIMLLQGCVAVFVAGAAAGGAVVYDRRNLKTIKSDQQIRHDVNTRIQHDPQFSNTHIVVAVFNHDILLTGEAPLASQRVTAEKIARAEPGVNRVYNEIAVSSPTSMMTQSSDTWITTKVKTELVATKNLRSGSIKVITENGVVYLMGIVRETQAELAVNTARRIAGVQRVVKVFQYKN